MGLAVELFAKNSHEEWEHVECLYSSMIGPSRQKIADTIYGFVWGQTDNYYDGTSQCYYLKESSESTVTQMSFSTLKRIWKTALNEELELSNKSITDNCIVCLATGN